MPSNLFNLEAYYSRLRTKKLGRPCLYFDQVDSTINSIEEHDFNTIVLAKEQTNGRGQRSNKWFSPVGCAMASVRLKCPKVTPLAKRVCFLQHILAMSTAYTLEKIDPIRLGRDKIGLKWPNDIIYKDKSLKLGGILLNSKDKQDHLDIILSFGLNVHNREPTICIEDILSTGAGSNEKSELSIDMVVAEIMNELEQCIDDLTDEKFNAIKADYESRCLQVNKVVLDANCGTVLVKGVNDDGYLVGEESLTGRPCMVTQII